MPGSSGMSNGSEKMNVLKITMANFDDEVMKSNKPVLLDFWAPWCGPCKMLGPVMEEVAGETAGRAKVGKINVDEEAELAERFGVSSIPTLVLIKDGKVATTSVGFKQKEAVLSMIQ